MGLLSHTEIKTMKTACNVCGSFSFEEQRVDDIYENPDGQRFVVENIPATVCTVCGERTLSLATARHIFALLDTTQETHKTIPVLAFAA
jgi:YgiT-type zinc finger domain-containing protein